MLESLVRKMELFVAVDNSEECGCYKTSIRLWNLERNVYLTTFYSGNVSQKALQELIDFVEKYQVDVAPKRVFTIDEIQDAHRYLESTHSFGKVIVRVKEKKYD